MERVIDDLSAALCILWLKRLSIDVEAVVQDLVHDDRASTRALSNEEVVLNSHAHSDAIVPERLDLGSHSGQFGAGRNRLVLLKYLADPEFMKEYYYNAIYGPAAQGYVDAPIFTESPVHEGLLDLALNGTFGSLPDVNNPALSEYQTNFLTPRMIQRIVVDGVSIDDAIAETQEACQAIYDKYNE